MKGRFISELLFGNDNTSILDLQFHLVSDPEPKGREILACQMDNWMWNLTLCIICVTHFQFTDFVIPHTLPFVPVHVQTAVLPHSNAYPPKCNQPHGAPAEQHTPCTGCPF